MSATEISVLQEHQETPSTLRVLSRLAYALDIASPNTQGKMVKALDMLSRGQLPVVEVERTIVVTQDPPSDNSFYDDFPAPHSDSEDESNDEQPVVTKPKKTRTVESQLKNELRKGITGDKTIRSQMDAPDERTEIVTRRRAISDVSRRESGEYTELSFFYCIQFKRDENDTPGTAPTQPGV
jgi:hypothetical protein